jgi:2-oxo-4-hydroxy-4-carboxy-5-ureidoimidazoline decarboxylase
MAEPHAVLNALDAAAARDTLTRCCGAAAWVREMLRERPYTSTDALLTAAERAFAKLERADWLEAFSHHPRIGEDLAALRARFASPSAATSPGPSPDALALSSREQAGVSSASERTLEALRDGNRAYRERFGHIFIICATGKSAAEMLAALQARSHNAPDEELAIASREQAQITRLRLLGLGR